MNRWNWPLLDADRNLPPVIGTTRGLTGGAAGSGVAGSVCSEVLRGGSSEGVHVVTLDNGRLSLDLLPTRGMGVWRGRCGGLSLDWSSPVSRPVNPAMVEATDRGGLGWLNGFNELLCRCGLGWNGPPGDDGGASLTLHGRIANIPAHRVTAEHDAETGRIAVTGVVDEQTMFGPCFRLQARFETEIGSDAVTIIDDVTNLGGAPAPLSLLYHINIAGSFLAAGATLKIAARQVAPRDARAAEGIDEFGTYAAPVAGYAEQAYFFEPMPDDDGWGRAALINPSADAAFVVEFDTAQLPCFTQWKNTVAGQDGYVTGLEPALNFPNFRSFEREQGRLKTLQPGETHRMTTRLRVLSDVAAVAALVREIDRRQAGVKCVVHRQPKAGWSPK